MTFQSTVVLSAVCLLCLVPFTVAISAASSSFASKYKLPDKVVPTHYDLKLAFNLEPPDNFTYSGIVDIMITSLQPTDTIVLHAISYTIDKENIKVTGDDDKSLKVLDATTNEETEFLTIQLENNLKGGSNYSLVIPFHGQLKDDLVGIYISQYKDRTTKNTEWLVVTQFEAIHARKGFPCFDEPALKATFKVSLGRQNDYVSVSNMPLVKTVQRETENSTELYWDEFETSVPMSTYLLAFTISKFKFLESPHNLSNTTFKIWARKDAIGQTKYASTAGPRVLSYFEQYFDVPFPLPKQDMFAIPDFSAGAMENWGLITYRETALLYKEGESSFSSKERVASVIAHELGHQWFGNLVTMKWWTDLWLNEGFATYIGALGVEHIEPTWQHMKGEIISNLKTVFTLDAMESSHAVSAPIEDPKRISEIFDAISYKKGCHIIRMMSMFLGENTFREGLTNYLNKFSYKNAEQDDLWWSLTQTAHKNRALPRNTTVKQIMDTWTTQAGYPILTVVRDYEQGTVGVTQKRYLSLKPSALRSRDNSHPAWWIPLSVLYAGEQHRSARSIANAGPVHPKWLTDQAGVEAPFVFPVEVTEDKWLVFNEDIIAAYRVNYDEKNWNMLIDTLNSDSFSEIPEMNRVQLLTDIFELAYSGIIDYSQALRLGNYLERETELLPLETGLDALRRIEVPLLRSKDYGTFQHFVKKLIMPLFERSGGLSVKAIRNPDDLMGVKLQTLTSSWACKMKLSQCHNNAIEMFQEWMETENPDVENPIPVDLRRTVYCVAIERGTLEHWNFLFARYQNANVASAKATMMVSLTCTSRIWLLQQYLEWAVDDGPEVRKQDAVTVFDFITRSSIGYYVAKPFIYKRIKDIAKSFAPEGRRIGSILKSVASQFTEESELKEFIEWTKKHEDILSSSKLAIKQAIESARITISWIKRHRSIVVDKLAEFGA